MQRIGVFILAQGRTSSLYFYYFILASTLALSFVSVNCYKIKAQCIAAHAAGSDTHAAAWKERTHVYIMLYTERDWHLPKLDSIAHRKRVCIHAYG